MCLYISKYATNELKKRFKESKDGTLTFWKVYRKRDGTLVSPSYGQEVALSGDIFSNRKDKKLKGYEAQGHVVSEGIHVWVNKPSKMKYYPYYSIVKVTAHKNDFIWAGDRDAVFMKINISKRTWSNLFRKKLRI